MINLKTSFSHHQRLLTFARNAGSGAREFREEARGLPQAQNRASPYNVIGRWKSPNSRPLYPHNLLNQRRVVNKVTNTGTRRAITLLSSVTRTCLRRSSSKCRLQVTSESTTSRPVNKVFITPDGTRLLLFVWPDRGIDYQDKSLVMPTPNHLSFGFTVLCVPSVY